MSHRMSSSLDDTIPLDKGTSKLELSDSNRTYYGSDMSLSSEKKSSNLSVKILSEQLVAILISVTFILMKGLNQ